MVLRPLEIIHAGKLKKPAIILLDIKMPKMSGHEFLQELRKDEQWHDLPVIMLTTSNSDIDKFEAFQLNVAGYVVKPVAFEEFVKAIETVERYWSLNEIPY
jgi:DNA-binding response OmpR family regulator